MFLRAFGHLPVLHLFEGDQRYARPAENRGAAAGAMRSLTGALAASAASTAGRPGPYDRGARAERGAERGAERAEPGAEAGKGAGAAGGLGVGLGLGVGGASWGRLEGGCGR